MNIQEFISDYTKNKYSRKYGKHISIFSLVSYNDMSLARKRFIQTFTFTKNEISELITLLKESVSDLDTKYSQTIEDEAMRVWGRPWNLSDYKISAVCSYDFSVSVRDYLRTNRHEYHTHYSAIICLNYVLRYHRGN